MFRQDMEAKLDGKVGIKTENEILVELLTDSEILERAKTSDKVISEDLKVHMGHIRYLGGEAFRFFNDGTHKA